MTHEKLNVQGMSCGHCVNSIEGSVGNLSGVESVKVHLQEGLVEVNFNEAEISLDQIKEAIEEHGYEVA